MRAADLLKAIGEGLIKQLDKPGYNAYRAAYKRAGKRLSIKIYKRLNEEEYQARIKQLEEELNDTPELQEKDREILSNWHRNTGPEDRDSKKILMEKIDRISKRIGVV